MSLILMDPKYNPASVESRIYQMWEEGGYFTPKIDPKKKPFTILLPPPNASGKMHTGNVLMIAIEDLLIRWHRMKGDPTLWIPGTDHAGIETQTTFERELKKQGQSRFDFDRQTFYQMVWEYVQNNKDLILQQLRQMGASVDWTRLKFTLDPDILKTVYDAFAKMKKEGLIYRGDYLINYSFKHGTTLSDAEIQYAERPDPLYYIRYFVIDRQPGEPEYITVATVRPEPIMIDTHLAVNPKDRKNKKWIGRKVANPLTNAPMEIISESFVDPKFGTGIVKLTPGHDKTDYQVAINRKDISIPIKSVIDWNGKINENGLPELRGKTILEARKQVIEILQSKNLIEKIEENYIHQVPVDYRSGDYIENLILPNWFVKVDAPQYSLKKTAYDAVKSGKIKIFPKWREITYLRWMENLHDWAISRQNVWGIRIPVWYQIDRKALNIWVVWLDENKVQQQGNIQYFLNKGVSLEKIKSGLQRTMALSVNNQAAPKYKVSVDEPKDGLEYVPETDTFDTWFSSGQWPYATLGYPDSSDYKYFYPTSVLETGWEIVTRWVSRMVMFGLYRTEKIPFENVYLHGHVRAIDGRKMSKSLGNMVNPDEYLQQYGADALRMGLISGTANGHDFNFPADKVLAYRNFANKIWNIGRFILINIADKNVLWFEENMSGLAKDDLKILKSLKLLIPKIDANLEKFRFAQAGELIYHFVWHELADKYLENVKFKIQNEKLDNQEKLITLSVLRHVYLNCLKLLHPFMPFVTEEIWSLIPRKTSDPLIISPWPTTK